VEEQEHEELRNQPSKLQRSRFARGAFGLPAAIVAGRATDRPGNRCRSVSRSPKGEIICWKPRKRTTPGPTEITVTSSQPTATKRITAMTPWL
jgi:hypothetical protein